MQFYKIPALTAVKVKVKFTPPKHGWHRGEGRGIALLFLKLRAGCRGGSRLWSTALLPAKSPVTHYRDAGLATGPSGKMWRRESL
jgi:hypothetical protein